MTLYLNHFTQPDSIVPDPNNSQDYYRYSYVRNNPIKYTDPSGHAAWNDKEGNNTLDFVKKHITDNDKQLTDAWLSLWKTNSGHDLARNIVKTKTPIKWADDLPPWTYGETTNGCAYQHGTCELHINKIFKVTDQYGNPSDLPSVTVLQDTNQTVVTLAHEAFHLNYGESFTQNSLYEEFLAYQTDDAVRGELSIQNIPIYNFNNAYPFSSAGLDRWFKSNELGSYSNLPFYPYNHRGDVWWQE